MKRLSLGSQSQTIAQRGAAHVIETVFLSSLNHI